MRKNNRSQCTCVSHFGTFLFCLLQSNNIKWPSSSLLRLSYLYHHYQVLRGTVTLTNVVSAKLCVTLSPPGIWEIPIFPVTFSQKYQTSALSQNFIILSGKNPQSPDSRQNSIGFSPETGIQSCHKNLVLPTELIM